MRTKLQATGLAGVLAALIALSLVMTTWGSATSATRFSTTHPGPIGLSAYAYDHSTLKAKVVTRDGNGNVVFKGTYDTPAEAIAAAKKTLAAGKDTGSVPSPSGCFGNTKVTVTETGHSFLGAKLYHVGVWIKWGWDCLAHDVNMLDNGRFKGVDDGVWQWDKWVDGASSYFMWDSPYAHSGYNKMAQGQFHGPCIKTTITCHQYPMAHERAHSDGTAYWETSDN